MPARWLKVEVEKTLIADVYVCVDDGIVQVQTRTKGPSGIRITDWLEKIAVAAAKNVLDWDGEHNEPEVNSCVEVTAEEAKQYIHEDYVAHPETLPEPPPEMSMETIGDTGHCTPEQIARAITNINARRGVVEPPPT